MDNQSELEEGPKGKVRNIAPGGDIMDDSFFDVLGDIDDGLGNPNFAKLGEESKDSIRDIVNDESLNLTPKEELKKTKPKSNIVSTALPTTTLPKQKTVKEKNMTKKFDPLNLPDDDPASQQMKEIWEHMNTPDASEYKLMVLRLEPQMIKSTKISGYLQTFHLPTTIPDIIEKVGETYGGGKYQIRIVDGAGKYVKSKTFEISGLPKIVNAEDEGKAEIPSFPSMTETTTTTTTNTSDDASSSTDDDDDDDEWEDDDFEFPRRRGPAMRASPYNPAFGSPYAQASPYNQFGQASPFGGASRYGRDESNLEEKITSKLDSKFDKIADALQAVAMNNNKPKESIINADVVKALAPLAISFLDNKSNRDNTNSSQFTEMNKQIVGLMEGMQNLVRIGDQTRESFTEKERRARDEWMEKERREREEARREALESQRAAEQRFLEEQRRAEERHQQMMLQFKESLESKHRDALQQEQQSRLQLEQMRNEAREREERLREEARKRDEDNRRRELEFWEKQRQDEMKWRAEMQAREEEARRREEKWREEVRQKELEKERELKVRELEMMKTMQDMNLQKSTMQQKLLEQVYSNNNQNRESQLQMEMAIAKMTADNEARIMQAGAEMQLEKIRHATQMQISKMRTELSAFESKKDDDPLDTAMQDYLKRRMQIDMIKELNMEVDEDDVPNGGIMGMAKKLLSDGVGSMLLKTLLGGQGDGAGLPTQMPQAGRVVAPNPSPAPKPVVPTPSTAATDEDLDDYEDDLEDDDDLDLDDEDMEDVDDESDEAENDESDETPTPDLDDINPLEEIPRVIQYFQFLKEAIDGGQVSELQASEEAKARLAPQIVNFLTEVEDSTVVISQLEPILARGVSVEFAQFFTQEHCIKYMNNLLAHLAGRPVPEEPKEDPQEKPKVKRKPRTKKAPKAPTKKVSVKDEVVEEKPTPKKRGRRKKTESDVQ